MGKKKIIRLLITFLALSVLSNVYLLYSNYSLRNILFQEQSSSTPKKKDLMSLMLETEQGSGMYEASKTEDGIGRKSGKKSKEQVVTAKPTNPTMAFDSTYNVVISGSTSRNGNVEYYYSLDNKSFTRGSSVTVSSTSTVYAYAVDTKNQKSDVVSKTVTIGTPQTGTVSTTYYCSKTNAYQSSSTCTYNYAGTRSSSPVCNSAMYPTYHNGKCGSRQIYNYSKSECVSWCSDVAYREKPASYACVQEGTGTESWSCYFYSAEDPFPYTCPNGGNLSGSTCIGATYSGSSRYKCSVSGKYYTTKSSATTGCTNYCANGSLYNSKCYYMS